MANVFVSYSRDSADTVKALIEDIEALGHDVWFDQELSGGQSWWDKILETVRSTDIFVVAIDPSSLKSKACTSEYEYAHALGVPIIPIIMDETVSPTLLPRALQMVQHVIYVDPDRDAVMRLARAFTSAPLKDELPDPLPEPPPAPMSYISEIAEKVRTTNTLDFAQQSALFIELKNGLSDPKVRGDSAKLLNEFRNRDDMLASVAKHVDALINQKPDNKPNSTQSSSSSDKDPMRDRIDVDDLLDDIATRRSSQNHEGVGVSQKKQSEDLAQGLSESAAAFEELETQSSANSFFSHDWKKGSQLGASAGSLISIGLLFWEPMAFYAVTNAILVGVICIICGFAFAGAIAGKSWKYWLAIGICTILALDTYRTEIDLFSTFEEGTYFIVIIGALLGSLGAKWLSKRFPDKWGD